MCLFTNLFDFNKEQQYLGCTVSEHESVMNVKGLFSCMLLLLLASCALFTSCVSVMILSVSTEQSFIWRGNKCLTRDWCGLFHPVGDTYVT